MRTDRKGRSPLPARARRLVQRGHGAAAAARQAFITRGIPRAAAPLPPFYAQLLPIVLASSLLLRVRLEQNMIA